jgi:hypothetical protein
MTSSKPYLWLPLALLLFISCRSVGLIQSAALSSYANLEVNEDERARKSFISPAVNRQAYNAIVLESLRVGTNKSRRMDGAWYDPSPCKNAYGWRSQRYAFVHRWRENARLRTSVQHLGTVRAWVLHENAQLPNG